MTEVRVEGAAIIRLQSINCRPEKRSSVISMIELAGVVGKQPTDVRNLTEGGQETENSTIHLGDQFGISLTDHSLTGATTAAEAADGDVLIWIFGDVYGHQGREYRPRSSQVGSAEFCAQLYDQYGDHFIEGLNGSFVCVLFNRCERTLSLITDRLSTRPVFYSKPTDETVVFSTQIQTLSHHPQFEPVFSPDYLAEFLAYKRVFGTKTPLSGVEELQPGAITTIDIDDATITTTSYWQPVREPVEKPFEHFLDEFVHRFQTIVNEWLADGQDAGLLLSGGSDSRLILGAADTDLTAYHMSGWMSREARTAEQIAAKAGASFRYLQRDEDYDSRLFEQNGSLSNFDGWFTQGYVTDFSDAIDREVDTLLSGLYGDTLFKGAALPTGSLSLGSLGSVQVPLLCRVGTVREYISQLARETPSYAPRLPDLEDVLTENIHFDEGMIHHHGVEYNSITELVHCGLYYPLSNDSELINSNSSRQICPFRTPFLDNRLIDLHLQIPTRYLLTRNFIDRAVERLAPELAAVPHAATQVPVNYPRPASAAGRLLTEFIQKFIRTDSAPRPYLNDGPWTNRAEFIRESSFTPEALAENQALIKALPELSWARVWNQYYDHIRGENHTVDIYSLLTLLSMPVTATIANNSMTDTYSPVRYRTDSDTSNPTVSSTIRR